MREYKWKGHYDCEEDRKCKQEKCNEFKPMVLTTGVLNTIVNQTAAHIELANLDPVQTHQIRVQVINWNSDSPVVLSNEIVTLLPNRHAFVTQNVSAFHYEVRIFHPGSPNVIANTFAIDAATFTLSGLTFNQKELMQLDIPFI